MDKWDFKVVFAPVGVASGIFLIMLIASILADFFSVSHIDQAIPVVPSGFFIIIGVCMIIIWLPVFIAGFFSLGQRGAVGQSATLRTGGIYRYIRNPMYAGISCTIIGTGLVTLLTGIVTLGFIWLVICCIQCLREEQELTIRFGKEYEHYQKNTPRFIPNVALFIKDVAGHR